MNASEQSATQASDQEQSKSFLSRIVATLKASFLFVWHFHRKLLYGIVITLAASLLIARLGAIYLEKNPEFVVEFIESNLQTKVSFDSMTVGVGLLYPSIAMQHFTIHDDLNDEALLAFSSAKIRLNVFQSLVRRKLIVDTVALSGFNALIRRNTQNEISIADIKISNNDQSKIETDHNLQYYLSLFKQTRFSISDSEIYFVDEMQKIPSVFVSNINFYMKNNLSRHQITLFGRLNESNTRFDLRLDFNGDINNINHWNGNVYASIDNLNQQALLHFLQKDVLQVEEFQLNDIAVDTKVWSTINKGNLQSVYGEVQVKNANLNRVNSEQKIHFDFLKSHFKIQRKKPLSDKTYSDWLLDLYDINMSVDSQLISEEYVRLKFINSGKNDLSKAEVFLDKLELQEFTKVIAFFSPKQFNDKVYTHLKPKGSLENINSSFYFNPDVMPIDIENYQVQADIKHFSINSFQALPKIRNFSARLILNESRGRVLIDSADMRLHLKSLFRDSWSFSQVKGDFFWQREDEQWLLGSENLSIESPHFSANADLNLWIAENGESFMDLKGFYKNVNVKAISNYLPVTVMSEGLVKWLDSSLLSGLVPSGGIAFRGELGEFPYLNHEGNMDIVFNTSNVLLDYQTDWPKLTDINAQVQFTQKGMNVEAEQSKIYSALSKNIGARINDYMIDKLKLTGDIKTNIKDGVKYLRATQLVSNDVIDMLDAEGDINLQLNLSIPLDDHIVGDSQVNISLYDVDYFPPGFDKKKGLVSHLKGQILVHNDTLNSKKLAAQIMGFPAKIKIVSNKKSSKSKKDPDVSIAIETSIALKKLNQYQQIPQSLAFLNDSLSGSSKLYLNLSLPNAQRDLSVNIKSDFKGIKSDLPEPLKKTAQSTLPFKMTYQVLNTSTHKSSESSLLKVSLANKLSAAILLETAQKPQQTTQQITIVKGAIAFEGARAKLPESKILYLSGALRQTPFAQWQAMIEASKKTSQKKEQSSLNPLSIPVTLAMSEIVFPELQFLTNKSEQAKTISTTQALQTKQQLLQNVPKYFPLINGYINSIKLGQVDLGRFEIQSTRIDNGIVYDKLSLKGELLSFNGKGKWHHWNVHPEVDLEGSIKIPSLELLSSALGNDQLIRDGKAEFSGYISWIGGLSDFSKETIEGKVNLQVEKGAWIEGKPGPAGRLLGLFNMNALTRRLSFDFSDVADEGFNFDKIEGDFRFKGATAYTDNFKIFAPSANILVSGSTGLVSEEIDQRVTVIPDVSATLPLAGAAVAGPAGAAVVWVGQKILGDQLNRVTAFDYTIKGNWDNPVIKKDKTSKTTLNTLKNIFGIVTEEEDEQASEEELYP
ncbi:YhdP family protein [sulfur-oxidizing endosymbiont of Gigantopelta aegis]|uniref:YhdP family phospholipid transporter n=1 Tax=sulfur-oxidizing endosymbiont of Gigantopelta aegis TaxID=2794934 RepID=UPI0018DDB0A5|nr:AsmA-like C-terminal region-containing protein [sulfur-oxidizing endosymbiont of Gigantopelta aegis]